MASPRSPWLMGLVLLASLLSVSANQEKEHAGNVTMQHLSEDAFEVMASLPSFPTIFAPASSAVTNQRCRNDSLLFLESLKNATLWAMEMFDSSAKFPTGLFVGVTYNLGNYDECLSVQASVQDGESPGTGFIGKYCLAKLEIPLSKLPAPTNAAWAKVKNSVESLSEPTMNFVKWAICMPSSCSASDLKSHLKYVLPKLHQLTSLGIPVDQVEVVVDDKLCSTVEDNTDLTTGQTALVCAIVALVILVCLGSTVDIASEKVSKGYVMEVLQCFSLKRNLKKLLSSYRPAAALGPISGAKFISMGLIIFGHRYLVLSQQSQDNPRFATEKYDDVDFAILLDGMLIVDTFFFLTGYLLSYYAIMESAKLKSSWSILYLYFRRYIRLTPVYMFIVAFHATLFIKLGSGPTWNSVISDERDRCLENWWINALYLNNVFKAESMCFKASWYLATDMQLFILSVPTVYLLIKKPMIGKIILGIFLAASLIIPFLVVYQYHLEPIMLSYAKNINDLGAYATFINVYIPSYMRATPYFVGIFGGCFVHYFNKNNMKLSKLQAHCITVASFILGFLPILTSTVFYQQNYEYNSLVAAAHSSLQRLSWALAIFFGIVVFNAGKEWYIMKFLSWRIFVPLSRLTYSAYLLHVIPHIYDYSSYKITGHFSWFYTLQLTAADITVAYLLSFAVSMILEAPWMNMEKLIFSNNEPSASEKMIITQPSSEKFIGMNNIENSVKGSRKDEETFLKGQHDN